MLVFGRAKSPNDGAVSFPGSYVSAFPVLMEPWTQEHTGTWAPEGKWQGVLQSPNRTENRRKLGKTSFLHAVSWWWSIFESLSLYKNMHTVTRKRMPFKNGACTPSFLGIVNGEHTRLLPLPSPPGRAHARMVGMPYWAMSPRRKVRFQRIAHEAVHKGAEVDETWQLLVILEGFFVGGMLVEVGWLACFRKSFVFWVGHLWWGPIGPRIWAYV